MALTLDPRSLGPQVRGGPAFPGADGLEPATPGRPCGWTSLPVVYPTVLLRLHVYIRTYIRT